MLHLPPISTLFPYTTLFRSLFEKTSIIAENSERDSEAAHDAEIILFGRILKKRLQHAERENHRCEWKRSEEHTSELQSHSDLVCRLLLEKKKKRGMTKT